MPTVPAIPVRRDEVHERMDRLVEELIRGAVPEAAALWTPPVDVEETEDAWIVEADVPGARKDDVNVEVNDNELVVHGEIKQRERTGVLRRRTRRVGEFEYRVTLPGDIDAEHIDAQLRDGVLRIRVPKSERARARRIEVQGES
jgi:HSP20 family protein